MFQPPTNQLWLFVNIALENGDFIVKFPMVNVDFPVTNQPDWL